ncbi:uncharacterized protein ycio [Phtheirospermum japonicum]|uniref:Threonylcarbamoyl-AMP synthase n=1 Tax=Phtheirospermum japonicum TaxID=374723 RepID=A0A830CFT5_9LAMI|nr:uncharacterized protein ycio [Phtheirospermum japonicum]
MAVELRRFGGAVSPPLSFRRSLSPHAYRLSIQSPPHVSRRFIALAVVKRSPKRLKYSTPRFTKEDGLLYVEVDPSGSDAWKLDPIVELLKEGAVGVIPTDTVYAIVCDMRNNDAIERLRRHRAVKGKFQNVLFHMFALADPLIKHLICFIYLQPLSILCRSFKDIDTYTTGFPRGNGEGLKNIFRAVKHCLPGPYTFILTASKDLPKQCLRYGTTNSKYSSRKNVGVRIPDDDVCKAILEKMDAPLISTSVKSPKENEWILDPVIIADVYEQEGLDFVVAAGTRFADPSTVVDMTGSSPQITRLGKGPKQPWMDAQDDEDSRGSEDYPQ